MSNQDAKDWEEIGTTSLGSLTNLPKVQMESKDEYAVRYFLLPVQQEATGDHPGSGDKLSKLYENICSLKSLDHPNLVRIRDVRKIPLEAKVAIFYELVDESCSLETLLKERAATGMRESEIKPIVKQICRALVYLHEKDVIHRFLNSANVIVAQEEVKLIDFGISVHLLEGASNHASSSCPRGLPNYMAPELIQEETSAIVYSRGSDIWALGCLVYEMTIGQRPFTECRSMGALSKAIRNIGAPDLPEGCSLELKSFYAACTHQDRKSREPAARLLEHAFLA